MIHESPLWSSHCLVNIYIVSMSKWDWLNSTILWIHKNTFEYIVTLYWYEIDVLFHNLNQYGWFCLHYCRFPGVPSEIQEENGVKYKYEVYKKDICNQDELIRKNPFSDISSASNQ